MKHRLQILLVEPSELVVEGICSVVKPFLMAETDLLRATDLGSLERQVRKFRPTLAILNPLMGISLSEFRSWCNTPVHIAALQTTLLGNELLQGYDTVLHLYDTADTIREKISSLTTDDRREVRQELSDREKEIIICVAKGMTNKQIAEELFLSAHTVMSHRRNIATKLKIHSPSGLTIYAITNNLVALEDVKSTIN